jgi:hypothetical protein
MMSRKILFSVFFALLAAWGVSAQTAPCDPAPYNNLKCGQQILELAGTPITVKVYTKLRRGRSIDRTFVVVHANEKKGLDAAKRVISETYGRLVEVVPNYVPGYAAKDPNNESRYLFWGDGKYCIDPNRIYTEEGRARALNDSKCSETPKTPEANRAVKVFADKFLNIVTNNGAHRFIIGIHNNVEGGLNIQTWTDAGGEAKTAAGIVRTNNHSNAIPLSEDDFILVTNVGLFNQFFNPKFNYNMALQEPRSYFTDSNGNIKKHLDDGSMSIYFGNTLYKRSGRPYSYINIEAKGKEDADDGSKKWQAEVIRRVITSIKP